MHEGYKLPQRSLVSQADSAMIERPDVPRSKFRGSWTTKKTFDPGFLVPFMVDEVLPGDQLSYDVSAYCRLATPLFPIFDNLRVDTFFFFVPNRLVWANWQKFMGEQANPADSINYTIPIVDSSGSPFDGFPPNTIYDHFGLPTTGQVAAGQIVAVNVLPLRAYNLIYNEWFRDQNSINSAFFSTGDGPDSYFGYTTRKRAKAQDYFTTALPWPQKFTAPTIPLQGQAPISGIGFVNGTSLVPGGTLVQQTGSSTPVNYDPNVATSVANTVYIRGDAAFPSRPAIFAELSQSTATFTVNALRQAFQVQTLLERDARGGTRYTELIKAHFGVTSPDARLQRPEYIGGGSTPLVITPVAQTAPVAGVAPLGALGGAGTAAGNHRANYASTEHGYIIGIINVRSELSYQQGLHRMWTRSTRYDFYWPTLAGLGEQAVLRQEIYCTGVDVDDQTVFGYQERWQEYRTRYSDVTGLFRSTTSGTIDQWHLAQRFTSPPVLGQTFIEDTPPMSRVLAASVSAEHQNLLADIMITRQAVRPIPTYGTPVSLGRF